MVVSDGVKMVTLDEFQEYVSRPENTDQLFELINGEIVPVSPGRTSNSEFSLQIVVRVHPFCKERNIPCHMSTGDGAYNIQGHVIAPDFAYKPTSMSNEYPDPEPPLWAVEIISPTDKAPDIRKKRQIYVQAGILYWEMYPESKSIDVYAPGQPTRTLEVDDILDGGDVLPDFTLPLKDLFED